MNFLNSYSLGDHEININQFSRSHIANEFYVLSSKNKQELFEKYVTKFVIDDSIISFDYKKNNISLFMEENDNLLSFSLCSM